MMTRIATPWRVALLLAGALLLSACGFQLRGSAELPFNTVYIQNSGGAQLKKNLERSLKANGVQVLPTTEGAQRHLELMSETSRKTILSLSGGGKVREYELLYIVTLRLRDASSTLWSEPQTIEQRRDYSYDDTQLLAKEGEEARLFNDMRNEATQEILRRLSVKQPVPPASAR